MVQAVSSACEDWAHEDEDESVSESPKWKGFVLFAGAWNTDKPIKTRP